MNVLSTFWLTCFRFVYNLFSMDNASAEIEFLGTLIRTCQAVRDPKRAKNRLELAVPAATWELKFKQRVEELKHKPAQPALVG